MKENLLKIINKVYSGDFQYVLSRYVNRNYWNDILEKELVTSYIDNLTDFSYSTCYSFFIYPRNGKKIQVGSDEFKKYLENNGIKNIVSIQVSAIAPYAVLKYFSYFYEKGNIKLQEQNEPVDEESREISSSIQKLLNAYNITVIPVELLDVEVPNISLELKESETTIYNCLFEDSY